MAVSAHVARNHRVVLTEFFGVCMDARAWPHDSTILTDTGLEFRTGVMSVIVVVYSAAAVQTPGVYNTVYSTEHYTESNI